VGTPKEVVPDIDQQIESDVLFDAFDIVQPGFGQGVDNKLFLENERRDRNIRYRQPMYYPNTYQGPLNTTKPAPWQLQPVMTRDMLVSAFEFFEQKQRDIMESMKKYPSHAPTLPGDGNNYRSCKSLKRPRENFLEPVIQNHTPMTPVNLPSGLYQKDYDWRPIYSTWRHPRSTARETTDGGPLLKKKRALEVVLP